MYAWTPHALDSSPSTGGLISVRYNLTREKELNLPISGSSDLARSVNYLYLTRSE